MSRYILKCLLLIVPTLLGIITVNFFIVQLAPGGPVDQIIAQMTGNAVDVAARVGGDAFNSAAAERSTQFPGAQGIDPELIPALEKQFGFDRPLHERYLKLSLLGKIGDYFWHLALPVCALTIGSFATLTMLTKNSFLDEISKQYVLTAKAKGINQRRVLYHHVFRNAMLIVIAGFPAAFIGVLFTGAMLIEVIF